MIPVLYPKNAATFTTNGLGRLTDCVSAVVHEKRNGAFELELEMPVDGNHFSDIEYGSIITAKPSPTRSSQPFVVYSIEKTMSDMMAVVRCEHISYRLSLIPVMPFTATSASQAMAGLLTNSAESNPFSFTTDVTRAGTYTQTVPSSVKNRMLGEQGSILQVYQGEYLFDGFTVSLLTARGINRGTTIRYGKNLTSLEQEINIQNTITGIVPYWTGMEGEDQSVMWLPEIVLYSAHAADFPTARTVCVDLSGKFDAKPTEAELRAAGQKYILENDIGIPQVGFDVGFVTLAQTTDYKGIALAERIDLCDTVTVFFPDFGIQTAAEVTEIKFDVLRERYTKVHIGAISTKLSETIANTSQAIQNSESKQTTSFLQALEQATAVINGDLTGASMITQTDANGNPVGLIFMDTTDPDTAVNCIRINANGIGFSNSGVVGPYSSAWLIDGTLDMQQINVINLSANSMTTGIIQDALGYNYWNLDTGDMRITSTGAIDIGARNYVRNSNTLVFDDYMFAFDFYYNSDQALVNGENYEVNYG